MFQNLLEFSKVNRLLNISLAGPNNMEVSPPLSIWTGSGANAVPKSGLNSNAKLRIRQWNGSLRNIGQRIARTKL
jgi:hypothetical protein